MIHEDMANWCRRYSEECSNAAAQFKKLKSEVSRLDVEMFVSITLLAVVLAKVFGA